VKRRSFITLFGGAAVAWPLAPRAQQPSMRVIGVLAAGGAPSADIVVAFGKGLSETGFIEGRNLAIVTRSTERYERLAPLATELAGIPVAAIFASGSANSVLAAKAATSTIPIVFANGSDPVRLGLVASMNRPGGNVTGVTFISSTLMLKRLELLRELVPAARTIALLVNPGNLRGETDVADIETAARSVGQQILVLRASSVAELEVAFDAMAEHRVGAVLVGADALFNRRADQIIALAARRRIPASYTQRVSVEEGGLISYGDDRMESHRQGGLYVGRILKGEKPADLPVLQPTKFELVINLKTAKTMDLDVPATLLARADEVIE
jgi:putative tryptophan/tyrosine transport system substrate-binding protein